MLRRCTGQQAIIPSRQYIVPILRSVFSKFFVRRLIIIVFVDVLIEDNQTGLISYLKVFSEPNSYVNEPSVSIFRLLFHCPCLKKQNLVELSLLFDPVSLKQIVLIT